MWLTLSAPPTFITRHYKLLLPKSIYVQLKAMAEGEGETEIENGEIPTCVSETCIGDRYQEYKSLILNIAECLGTEDVRKIAYIQNLPAEILCQASSLQVLQLMERHGIMFDYNIRPLANVLELINRHDLVNDHIKQYLSKHGELLAIIKVTLTIVSLIYNLLQQH